MKLREIEEITYGWNSLLVGRNQDKPVINW